MILSTRPSDGSVIVAELKTDKDGKPLLAKACGKVAVGDALLAVNDTLLSRFGTPTLDAAASQFKSAPRPVRVLFHRTAAVGIGGGSK